MDDSRLAEEYSHLDYEKSIKRHRLVYKPEGSLIFSIIFDYIMLIIFVGIGITLLFEQIIAAQKDALTITIVLFAVTWLILNAFLTNYLVKIERKITVDNRKNIPDVMDKFFSSYDFVISDEKMMRSFKPAGSPIWGRIITIIFDGEVMYLNITTLGKSNSPTWIHAPLNYIRAKRIAGYFRKHYC